MKKVLAFLMAMCLCVGLMCALAGCNTPTGDNHQETTEPTQDTTQDSNLDSTQDSTSDVDFEIDFDDLP